MHIGGAYFLELSIFILGDKYQSNTGRHYYDYFVCFINLLHQLSQSICYVTNYISLNMFATIFLALTQVNRYIGKYFKIDLPGLIS